MENTYLFPILFIFLFSSVISFSQDKLSPGDHFAEINNIKIHYYVSGNGPVCLMPTPGWGPDITIYKNSLTPLEKYFKMVYYDTRSSGQSTGPDDQTQYTLTDFMNDMDSLRVYLEQPKVWLMGHSDGGYQVLNYGIINNDRLYGIVSLHSRVVMDSIYKAEFTKMILSREGQPYYDKAADIFFGKDKTKYTLSEFIEITMPFFFHDVSKMDEFIKLGDPNLSDKAYESVRESKFSSLNLLPELHKVTVPVLVVTGDDDFIVDKISQADRIHNNLPNSEEIEIKNTGHFSWVEQPEQFFKEVSAWLERQGLKAN